MTPVFSFVAPEERVQEAIASLRSTGEDDPDLVWEVIAEVGYADLVDFNAAALSETPSSTRRYGLDSLSDIQLVALAAGITAAREGGYRMARNPARPTMGLRPVEAPPVPPTPMELPVTVLAFPDLEA